MIDLEKIMRVSGGSNVKNVAMCLVRFLEKSASKNVELRAIGEGAVNQAVKSIACARGFLSQSGQDLCVRVGFISADDTSDKTAMKFIAFIKNE